MKHEISYSIINLDKPAGMTCREIDELVKNKFGCKKTGHTGTLDFNATGVLIVCCDETLKAMPLLIGMNKEYEGSIYLHKDVPLKLIRKTIKDKFTGIIIQIPPVKSRVARKSRKRNIYSFKILKKKQKNLYFRAKVESGTYIRKLASDLGKELGTGAHLKTLIRTRVGPFLLKDSVKINKINKIIPIEKALKYSKKVYVKKASLEKIRHGAPINQKEISRKSKTKPDEKVAIFYKNKLIAIGIAKNKSLRIDRVLKVRE